LPIGLAFAADGGAPPVAFDVHLEDGGVVDEAIDGGDGHRRIADAILDCVVHRAHRLELKGPSLRKRQAVTPMASDATTA
jgi:hypothetical protein